MRKKKTTKRKTNETNGPFDVFHIDGNYKLKRFGFVIRECIDGFGFLFQPKIMISLLLRISILKLLQIWAKHQIHYEWT